MNVSPVNSTNFKGYAPARYYAVSDNWQGYMPITSENNIRKCQNKLIRNLNRTINNPNEEINQTFSLYDKDYRKNPRARSHFFKKMFIPVIVTGDDATEIDRMGKKIGEAKKRSIEITGSDKSFETMCAKKDFFQNTANYLKYHSKRLKSGNGKALTINGVFEPKYNKKGEVKDFELKDVIFSEASK